MNDIKISCRNATNWVNRKNAGNGWFSNFLFGKITLNRKRIK